MPVRHGLRFAILISAFQLLSVSVVKSQPPATNYPEARLDPATGNVVTARGTTTINGHAINAGGGGGGGGLSDGDKGDITVSGTGSVWTIDNNTVSLAKLADMATASFLGRNTAGTGDPEVLSISTAKTMLNLSGTNSGDQIVPSNTTATTSQFFTAYNSTTGAFTKAQPASSDLSDASNIQLKNGTLALGGFSSITGTIAESNVLNLTTDLAAKAADSAVVHNTGTETIAGAKTFSTLPTFPTQTANRIFAGPTTGSAAAPTFRALVAADIPTLPFTGLDFTSSNLTSIATRNITDLQGQLGYADDTRIDKQLRQNYAQPLNTVLPIFSTLNHSGSGTYVRNTACWIKGAFGGGTAVDLTAISVYNSAATNTGAILISPRHVLYHGSPLNGATLRFVTNANAVVSRTITNQAGISGTQLTIGLLDSDVPGTITPAKVLPQAFNNADQFQRVFAYITQNDQKVYVAEQLALSATTGFGGTQQSFFPYRARFYKPIAYPVTGDLGMPAFYIFNDTLVCAGMTGEDRDVIWTAHAQHNAINAVMTSLGGGYQLTDFTPTVLLPHPPMEWRIPNYDDGGSTVGGVALADANGNPVLDLKNYLLQRYGGPAMEWSGSAFNFGGMIQIGGDNLDVALGLSNYLRKDDNLSGLDDVSAARDNLQLGSGDGVTFSALTLTSLSASQYVKTNGSKVLVSALSIPVGDLSGLGTGVGTFLTTASSANLRAALTDELGSGAALFDGAILATGITFPQTGLAIKGATANALTVKPNETLSAARTLNLVTGNADRTLTLSGSPTLGDWFNQSVKTTASPTFTDILQVFSASDGAYFTAEVNNGDDLSNQLGMENVAATGGFYLHPDGLTTGRHFHFPDSNGTFAITSNNLSAFAATTSAQLRGVLSDENGTGAALFDSATNPTFTGATISSGSLTMSGNQSAAAWTTSGIRIKGNPGTLTDTSSSGTVATAYTNVLGGNTIAASSATTFTNYFGLYLNAPVAGTNVTLTNAWGFGADSAKFGTSNPLTISTSGVLTATSPVFTTPVLGTPASGTLTNCTFPTLNQNTTGSAASLSISGQTGLLTFTGLASTNRAKTVRDAADTILELGGSYTPTGTWTNLTLVTPALGTPSALVLTNATGSPTGISLTKAQLNTIVSDDDPAYLGTAQTFTVNQTNSYTSTASTPAMSYTGTVFTGGSATTTKPHFLIEPTGTTSTAWSTSGTQIGVNAVSGFAGNLLDLQVAAATKFKITSGGAIAFGGNATSVTNTGGNDLTITAGQNLKVGGNAGATWYFSNLTNGPLLCINDNLTDIGQSASTRPRTGYFGTSLVTPIVNFGGTTNSFSQINRDAVNGFTLQSAAGTSTWNDSSTAASGTVANRYLTGWAAPTLTATNATVTYTDASTVYIGGAPTRSTNIVASGNLWALNVSAGATNLGGSVKIGGGSAILKVLSATATLDFGNLATIGCEDLTVTVTGAALGDVVSLGAPNGSIPDSNWSYPSAWVSAADTVTVRGCTLVSGNPASGVFRVQVNQF